MAKTDSPEAPVDPSERRVFSRRGFEVKVDFFSANTFFTGFTENISEGGLFIATEAPFEIGDELDVTLSLMGKEPTGYKVVVRWIRPPGAIGGLPAGMGVQFKHIPEDERVKLQGFIDSGVKDTLFFDLD
jgi:uncharacterized protein (TIGR02266 family)